MEPIEDVVRHAIDGDEDAWSALYLRLHPAVQLEIGRVIWGNSHLQNDPPDVEQLVWSRIRNKLNQFEGGPRGSLEGWVRTLARNVAFDFVKSHPREEQKQLEELDSWRKKKTLHDDKKIPRRCHEYLLQRLSTKDIEQEVDLLTPNRREVFKMHVEGASGVEIAKMRGTTPVTARQHVSRGCRDLRLRLTAQLCGDRPRCCACRDVCGREI